MAYVPRASSYSFTLTAAQYGSYADYQADEEKYKYPDAIDEFNMKALKGIKIDTSSSASDDISVNIGSDNYVTVTLKEDAIFTGSDIKKRCSEQARRRGLQIHRGYDRKAGYIHSVGKQSEFS